MSGEVDFSALEVMFNEAIYRLHEAGQIDKDQRDKLVDLLEHIDEYSYDEFMKAWREATA